MVKVAGVLSLAGSEMHTASKAPSAGSKSQAVPRHAVPRRASPQDAARSPDLPNTRVIMIHTPGPLDCRACTGRSRADETKVRPLVIENARLSQRRTPQQPGEFPARVRRPDRVDVELLHEAGVVSPKPANMQGKGKPGRTPEVAQQDHAARLGHPRHLVDHGQGVAQMMQHRIGDDEVEASVREAQASGVGGQKPGAILEALIRSQPTSPETRAANMSIVS